MIIASVDNVTKSYGAFEVFREVTLAINDRERIGLIGRNGSGKTTLLEIIAGLEKPDKGQVSPRENLRLGYLRQEPSLLSEISLYQEIMTVFQPLIEMSERMRTLEKKMSEKNNEDLERILKEYGEWQAAFEHKGGYTYESKIDKIMSGLGFEPEVYDRPVDSFSGGERTRIELAKVLLTDPELLLLDEPTNHLDINMTEWLEDFLQNFKGAMVIVSHDRYFLDKLVDRVVELEFGKLSNYAGNYSYYVREKELRFRQAQQAYDRKRAEIERLDDIVREIKGRSQKIQNGPKSGSDFYGRKAAKLARKARTAARRLERLKKDLGKSSRRADSIKLDIELKGRSGERVIEVRDLAKSFEDKLLFEDVNFTIRWGEKVGLVGANGTGKTTLLNIILGNEPFDSGEVILGNNLTISYCDQKLAGLNYENNLYDEIRSEKDMTKNEIHYLLSRFLFSEKEIFAKKVKDLSGGEKSRMILAKLVISEANLLVLDEPANHLDISSLQILEEALAEFPGTILLVSHDRYLLNKITDRIIELWDGKAICYPGGYSYYEEKKKDRARLQSYSKWEHIGEAIDEKEKRLKLLEHQIALLNYKLGEMNLAEESEEAQELNKRFWELKRELDTLRS